MKYAFMTFSTPELDLAAVLEVARQYGYDGIEPRLDAKHAHGVEVAASASQRDAIRRQADQAGIALACLATSLTFADPAKTDATIRDAHERIDLAGDVGAPAIRVFGGGFGDELDREQAVELTARSLASVADHAGERGVCLCLETHDSWCDPAHVAAVVGRADHPAVAVNWDIMHPVRTELATIDESFEALRPWIRHLHVHDGPGEGGSSLAPIGEGKIDHRRALELLKTIDYDGAISGEWINWQPYDQHLPRELATLKRYEQELG